MMESDSDKKCDHVHEPTYTPTKLPLLISRPTTAAETPPPPPPPSSPPQTTISVPFKWEEAPGKPRHCHTESEPDDGVKRTLELPPRLLFLLDGPSPTTVLDGPYVGRAMSFTTSYRTPRGYCNSNFGSSRWSGYKKITTDDSEGSFDFSPDCSTTTPNVKITRVPRRGSSWTLSKQRSHIWASIYESFKQVVPWKRKQQTQKKCASKFHTV
ncbi:unnamed protein product [Sphenostylis stenocarpa]|uniref:Uncharacterized protein n=1 Tax=Sphenostylis stenocarpa TaxID=92480 RepID=A0AA86SX11_9FABA|nr:unnamed protein product [Sphenostylis stenocarpa]